MAETPNVHFPREDLPALPTSTTRFSLTPAGRIAAGSMLGGMAGLILGTSNGAKASALRFRAENAHRLPHSTKGWYLYHKSKNYAAMFGGVKEGMWMAAKLGFWVGSFFAVEASVDRLRRRRDAASTTVAGLTVAGVFSAWHRLPIYTAARTAKIGLLGGLTLGLAQDALAVLKGERVGYIERLRGK